MPKKKNKQPLFIGLVGTAGSGKDTAASYIKHKYGAEEFRFSYLLVKALEIFGIEVSRENLAWLMNILKRKYGKDVLTKAMTKTIRELAKKPIIVLSGMRLPSDYTFLRSFGRNYLVFLDAPEKIRWQRVRVRGEKTDDNVTFKEFKKLTTGENERYIRSIGKKADFVVSNGSNLRQLHREIDKTMDKILRDR
ncbi:MAG: AAA family ATPase [Candidatus Moraniibacteriota bacterium]